MTQGIGYDEIGWNGTRRRRLLDPRISRIFLRVTSYARRFATTTLPILRNFIANLSISVSTFAKTRAACLFFFFSFPLLLLSFSLLSLLIDPSPRHQSFIFKITGSISYKIRLLIIHGKLISPLRTLFHFHACIFFFLRTNSAWTNGKRGQASSR